MFSNQFFYLISSQKSLNVASGLVLMHLIYPEHRHNFEKKDNDLVETFELPYDYDSLMHYPNGAFAKPGKNVTIASKVSHFYNFPVCCFTFSVAFNI